MRSVAEGLDYGDPTLCDAPPFWPATTFLQSSERRQERRPIFFAWWWYFGRAHSKNRHQKTGACSQSASQPPACRPYLRPTKIAGPLPESLALQIAAVIAWSYSKPDTSLATKVKWSGFETCLLLPCNSGSGRQPRVLLWLHSHKPW